MIQTVIPNRKIDTQQSSFAVLMDLHEACHEGNILSTQMIQTVIPNRKIDTQQSSFIEDLKALTSSLPTPSMEEVD